MHDFGNQWTALGKGKSVRLLSISEVAERLPLVNCKLPRTKNGHPSKGACHAYRYPLTISSLRKGCALSYLPNGTVIYSPYAGAADVGGLEGCKPSNHPFSSGAAEA